MPGTWNSPFSETSPWNTAIGTGALYVPAGITGITLIEEENDIIINTPGETERDVYVNDAGWDDADRCEEDVDTGTNLPIPDDFVLTDSFPNVFNDSSAVVKANGTTVYERQPFNRCESSGSIRYFSGSVPVEYEFATDEGLYGSHGGSGLSALGGLIRLNEGLTPGETIQHTLKILLPGSVLSAESSSNDPNEGFRWPASAADTGFESSYTGTVPECRMGSLLALLPDFDVDDLETEPAKIIARTLIARGAIVCDLRTDAGVCGVCYETSPDETTGERVSYPDTFNDAWGFYPIADTSSDAYGRDWLVMLEAMQVVDNNTEDNIGGGGGATTAWMLGAFALDFEDSPDDGDIEFTTRMRWSKFNPIGYTGTILTYIASGGAEHRLHFRLGETAMNQLKATVDAHQEILFKAPRPNLATGVLCGITEFSSNWNRSVPGDDSFDDYWYDVWVTLVETGS